MFVTLFFHNTNEISSILYNFMQIIDELLLKPSINFKQAFITVLTNIVFMVTWQPRRAPTNNIPKIFNCLAISFRYFSHKASKL